MREEENITDEKVWDIDREKILAAPERISNIVTYIRQHFDQKTKRNSFYQLKERRLAGFNAIFSTASIDVCKLYYNEFQRQQQGLPEAQQLKIATIFSYGANDEIPDELLDKEIVVTIGKAIDSSVELRNKKDLIDRFIASLTPETSVDDDWRKFVAEKQKEELNRIIADENLNQEETEKFVHNAFCDGFIKETGTAITKLLPPLNPFAPNNQYVTKKTTVLEKLKQFFDRFFSIIN